MFSGSGYGGGGGGGRCDGGGDGRGDGDGPGGGDGRRGGGSRLASCKTQKWHASQSQVSRPQWRGAYISLHHVSQRAGIAEFAGQGGGGGDGSGGGGGCGGGGGLGDGGHGDGGSTFARQKGQSACAKEVIRGHVTSTPAHQQQECRIKSWHTGMTRASQIHEVGMWLACYRRSVRVRARMWHVVRRAAALMTLTQSQLLQSILLRASLHHELQPCESNMPPTCTFASPQPAACSAPVTSSSS